MNFWRFFNELFVHNLYSKKQQQQQQQLELVARTSKTSTVTLSFIITLQELHYKINSY